MGKTGSVNWMQVKGAKTQIRLVSQKDADVKKPGPNQRFKTHAVLKKLERMTSESGPGRRAPGGRGRSRGGPRQPDPRYRRHMHRNKSAQLGPKQKAKK